MKSLISFLPKLKCCIFNINYEKLVPTILKENRKYQLSLKIKENICKNTQFIEVIVIK